MALGYRYHTGSSVPKNCEKALYFYEQAAATGKLPPYPGPPFPSHLFAALYAKPPFFSFPQSRRMSRGRAGSLWSENGSPRP